MLSSQIASLPPAFHVLKAGQRVQKLQAIFWKLSFDIIYGAGFRFPLNITS